ncbi:MAG: MmgE/PrpD family protein [Gemmatimonadota bacterium]
MSALDSATLTRELTRLVRTAPVAPDDLRSAERYVRDWVGSLVAGHATPAGRALLAYADGQQDLESRIFLAAALSHITETDDLHRASVTHPACVVIPAALVLGHSLGASGAAVLRAVLSGYEAMLRVGEALGPAHYRLFHNTATAGVFGSAAAAASLLDLDEDQWVWALGNAGTQAAGLWQFKHDASMSKHLHAGHAAQAGVRAALLAQRGFTGPSAILEGEQGFFRALCPDARPEAVLERAYGWKLAETSLKPYPCCRHTHPAIDAALEIQHARAEAGLDVSAVRALRVQTYSAARQVTDDPDPQVPYAAKFSIQFCVATALLRGRPELASFESPRLEDAAVRALLRRTEVSVVPDLEAAYPARWGAAVEVDWREGGTSHARCEAARGDPEAPLDDRSLDEKVRALLRYGGLEDDAAEALLHASRALAQGGDVFPLPLSPSNSPNGTTR